MDLLWKEFSTGDSPPEQKSKQDFSLLTRQWKGTQHASDQGKVLCAEGLQ